MARKEAVRIVVVVEDRQLERFIRRTLEAYRLDPNKIRVRQDFPKGGAGSGKRYVEKVYREEIVTYRRKARENVALLLGTEADEQGTNERANLLDSEVTASGQEPRKDSERIAYWIPKRHVETWGLHLTGTSVDENTDYHDKGGGIDWRTAGRGFREEHRQFTSGTVSSLPSLNRAYEETERLKL